MDKDKEIKKNDGKFSSWFAGIKSEYKRVSWPSRPDAIKMTASVVVVSAIMGVIIFGYDSALAGIYNLLLHLVRG